MKAVLAVILWIALLVVCGALVSCGGSGDDDSGLVGADDDDDSAADDDTSAGDDDDDNDNDNDNDDSDDDDDNDDDDNDDDDDDDNDDDDDDDDDNDDGAPADLSIELIDGGAFDPSAIGAAFGPDGTAYVAAVLGRTLFLYASSGGQPGREALAFPVAHAEMAMDAGGAMHFAYINLATGDVECLMPTADGWTAETVAPIDLASSHEPELALALGPDGSPHLVIVQETVVYAARGAKGWELEDVGAPGTAAEAALAVDEAGVPHLVYAGLWSNYAYVDYATRGDRGWDSARIVQQLADEQAGELFYINYYAGLELRFDPTGQPELIFGDNRILCEFVFYECSATLLRAISSDGAAWSVEEIQTFASTLVENAAARYDASSRLHAAYSTAWFNPYADGGKDVGNMPGNLFYWRDGLNPGGIAGGALGAVALALDAADAPFIAWTPDRSTLSVARRPGAQWATATWEETGVIAGPSAMALSPQGAVNVVYYDETSHQLVGAAEEAGGWTVSSIGPLGEAPDGLALAVDANGRRRVALVTANEHQVILASDATGEWEYELVDLGPQHQSTGCALALDTAGDPHLVFVAHNEDVFDGIVTRGVKRDGQWEFEEIPSVSPGSFSLAVDSVGLDRLAFINNGSLGYAIETAEGWEVGYPPNVASSPRYVALALDAADRPRLATASGHGQLMTYAELIDEEWRAETFYDSGYQERIERCDLALDAAGEPHIVFADVNVGALGYAARRAGAWTGAALDVGGVGLWPQIAIADDDRVQATYLGGQGVWRATFTLPPAAD